MVCPGISDLAINTQLNSIIHCSEKFISPPGCGAIALPITFTYYEAFIYHTDLDLFIYMYAYDSTLRDPPFTVGRKNRATGIFQKKKGSNQTGQN